MKLGRVVIEGKTKVVHELPDSPGQVLLQSKDRITAGDGARGHDLEGKAAISTATTCAIFELLIMQDDENHDPQWSREQCIEAKMKVGGVGVTLGPDEYEILAKTTVTVFEILERSWASLDCSLIDMKIEYGVRPDTGTAGTIGWEPVNSRIITAKFITKKKDIKLNIIQYNTGYEDTMGTHGLGQMNENGERFADFCALNQLVIGGSIFPHKRIHKATWRSPDHVTENQIDHICISRKFRRSWRDVRVMRGADKLEVRKEKKTALNTSRTRRAKAKAQEEYTAADREVKRSTRKDKRDYIDNLASQAEEAARQGNLKDLYQVTKKLAGKFQQTDKPIPAEAIKADTETAVNMLHSLFSKIWEKEEVPAQWKEGIVIKLPKKGDLRDCSNYRGIMLLSVPGKVLNRILLERMREAVDPMLRDQQAGFRRNRSCADQIASLRIIVEQSLEWNSPSTSTS
nr:hypothetical protein BaRGS_000796 [Batillaria attramentaria]